MTSITPKFNKTLTTFFEWFKQNNYSVIGTDKNDNDYEINIESLRDGHIEAGRNKLVSFIKKEIIAKKYCIFDKNEEEVKNINELCDLFNEKPTPKIEINKSIDTSDTGFIETLSFSTKQLTDALGKPSKTGNESTKHKLDFTIAIGKNVYTIYDWTDENEEYAPDIWHLGGCSNIKSDIKRLKQLISGVRMGEADTQPDDNEDVDISVEELEDLLLDDD